MKIETWAHVQASWARLERLASSESFLGVGVFAACVLLALCLCGLLWWSLQRAFERDPQSSRPHYPILLGQRLVDGVLFPILLLLFVMAARAWSARWDTGVVLDLALPLCLWLLAIRLTVKVLQAAFHKAPMVRMLERSLSWLAWLALVLWVTGLLPALLEELDDIHWRMGGSTLSVRTLLEGILTAGLVLMLSLWISSWIEARLLRNVQGGELSLRMAASNALKALLMFVGVILALSAVGIDLTALSVLGGAIGVGIGFGLQKLAANYVSGFVILAERSMRIGDNVKVDGFEGRITEINARYSVIRSLTGRESIVPNEMLITQRVENLSLADSKIWQSTQVLVAYDSDVEQVMHLIQDVCSQEARILKDPAPQVALSNFGADGLEFTVGYWIADPENGQLNLKSLINLGILQAFRKAGIEIPFPQRVIHKKAS